MIREPWDQRLDEPSAQYRLFIWWRDQIPRPPPSDLELARTFDWSTRAAAWDAHRSVPVRLEDQAEAAVRDLTEAACLYARRVLSVARTGGAGEITAKDAAALVKFVVQIQVALLEILELKQRRGGIEDTSAEEHFAARLSPDEQRQLAGILAKVSE
jgi:hypothetical protein